MGTDDRSEDERDPRWRITPTKIAVTAILLVAIVVPLLSGSYSRVEPRLLGFPFFYWYQLMWVFLAAGCCWISYLLLRREAQQFQARRHTSLTPPTAPPHGGAGSGPDDTVTDRRAE